MISGAWLKLKIMSAVLGVAILLQSPQGRSFDSRETVRSSVECGDAIKNLNQSPILNPQTIDQKIQNLAALKLSLDLAKVTGSSDIDITAMKAHYEGKEQELVAYLTKNKIMTRSQLIKRIKHQITMLQGQNAIDQKSHNEAKEKSEEYKEKQEREIKDNAVDGTRAISHRIKHGSFMMGVVGKQKSVTLTKSFDMMATATTQLFYKTIASLANTRFPEKYKIYVAPSKFTGDLHPVENVSYDAVQIWISALNDLSKAGESALTDLIPGHKQGDVYRLPTEAEWEFVIRGRGTLNETFHFGNEESDLKDYAWYEANAGRTTHPVAQKKPLIIDGKEFFDMHGNVWEWVQDRYSQKLTGGVDPQGPKGGEARVVRGGSWSNGGRSLRSSHRMPWFPEVQGGDMGFRLVRTVE